MKTISDYTIYCTLEQTRKALELGAPIIPIKSRRTKETVISKNVIEYDEHTFTYVNSPTVEQMCNWLRKEKNIFFIPKKVGDNNYVLIGDLKHFQTYDSYEEAILAGIDISLVYLAIKKLLK